MNPIVRMMKHYINTPLKKALPLLLISALVLASTTGCTTTTQKGQGSLTPTAFGEPVRYTAKGGINYTVTVYSANKVDSYGWNASVYTFTETARAGQTFILVDCEFRNSGSDKFTVSGADFEMQDSTGYKYDSTVYLDKNDLSYEKLSPGQHVRGVVSFKVPQNATGLQLLYDPTYYDAATGTTTLWNIA
jgi:hypothetical protein